MKDKKKFSPTLKNESHTKIPEPRCRLCGRWFSNPRHQSKMLICPNCRITKKNIIPHSVSIPKPYSEWTLEQKRRINANHTKWQSNKRKTDPEWKKKQNAKTALYNKRRRLVDDEFRKKMNKAGTKSYMKRYHNDPIFAEKERKKERVKRARKKALFLLRYLDNVW